MEAIGKLVQSRLLQHHRHQQQHGLQQEGGGRPGDEDEGEEGRVKSEVMNDSIERGGGGSSRQSVGGTFSIDSLLR